MFPWGCHDFLSPGLHIRRWKCFLFEMLLWFKFKWHQWQIAWSKASFDCSLALSDLVTFEKITHIKDEMFKNEIWEDKYYFKQHKFSYRNKDQPTDCPGISISFWLLNYMSCLSTCYYCCIISSVTEQKLSSLVSTFLQTTKLRSGKCKSTSLPWPL